MLQKLARIKGFGVFSDYTWDGQLEPFKRYNIIYGDNGSGKTTLSRLLDSLVAAKVDDHPELEYRIETDGVPLGVGQPSARRIRVFNADYVNRNIGQLDGTLKPILVIGEENKALADQLKADEADLVQREKLIGLAREQLESLGQTKGKLFTRVASTISQAIVGSSTRTYRKNNAEADYAALEDHTLLTDEDLAHCRTTLSQEVMEAVNWPASPMFEQDGSLVELNELLRRFRETARELGARTVSADTIERLKADPAVSAWVEQGLGLHKLRRSVTCEFCSQPVPQSRWDELAAHFNAADQALKDDISKLIESVENLRDELRSLQVPVRVAFYQELRGRLAADVSLFDQSRATLLQGIDDLLNSLQGKMISRSTGVSIEAACEAADFVAAWGKLAALATEHNDKTNKFDEEKAAARSRITTHYLSEIRGEVDRLDTLIGEKTAEVRVLRDGAEGQQSLAELHRSIDEKKAQISSAHIAAELLTGLLHTFLGRAELTFQSSERGYSVMRHDRAAKRLSDGERTAIAFIYFIVHLGDQDFDLQDGIVVIDDPVSSLDANAMYQAFAFLKNAVEDAKQVFLLTHNFSFLRLVLNWLGHHKQIRRQSAFYMLVCQSGAVGRKTSLRALDATLIDHPTEYHFLFKTLVDFRGDGTIAACYHIPNVARKVLETFLDFHAPGRASVYTKLNSLDFDENKRMAIYKFTNDLSHRTGQGFEPGLVEESQKNAKYLLELIEHVAPKHYEGMIDAVRARADA